MFLVQLIHGGYSLYGAKPIVPTTSAPLMPMYLTIELVSQQEMIIRQKVSALAVLTR